MKTLIDLTNLQIPTEFKNRTSFIFEINDDSFEHIGLPEDTVALVDNSKTFSTVRPIAFYLKNERMVGLAENILEDLYQLKQGNIDNIPTLFTKTEIEMIGQIRGFYKPELRTQELRFEKI